MKKYLALIVLLAFSITFAAAQELFDWDIDSLFDDALPETDGEETTGDSLSVLDSVKKAGLTVNLSYEFQGGLAPGWEKVTPWHFNGDEVLTWGQGVKMNSSIALDARISEIFRVRTVFKLNIPGPAWFSLGDFFFDYNILNTVFLRAGKYEQSWGISSNFEFTNLLTRVPQHADGGEAYVVKADIPIGVGGIQALALTRANLIGGATPNRGEIGFGGKFNLALRRADFDFGVFYRENMPLRGFSSAKTTIWNTEFYSERLISIDTNSNNEISFAGSVGFAKDFFGEKLDINGEFFYNGEKGSLIYRPETNLREADTLPFMEAFNIAFNVLYRFDGKAEPRFFVQVKYMPAESSAQLIPGFRIKPLSHVEIYLAAPMALGSKSGYYYDHNADPENRPFSIMLLVTLTGSVQAGQ